MNSDKYLVEIDLGRAESDMAMPASLSSGSAKKGKKRIYYPTLYIENVEGLPALPKEGCIMVKFRRKSMRVDENMDGKESAGMTLEIQKLCLPEDMIEDAGDDMESALKQFAKDAGHAEPDGDEEADAESDDEDGDEE